MTREKAHEEADNYISCDVDNKMAHTLVDRIYNDFESRTCENCKRLVGKDKQSKCILGYLPDNLYEFEFCCNKFEAK